MHLRRRVRHRLDLLARKLFGQIAKATGARALIVDYHFAPAHTHPAQVDETVTAYRWLLAQGIRAAHVAFTGDSCGGGLAITAQLRAREQGLPLYADLSGLGPVYIQVGADEVLLDDARQLYEHAGKAGVDVRLDDFPDMQHEPTEPHARALLAEYIAGFENADTAALERALRTDAAIELVGTRTWFSGRAICLRFLARVIGSPGDWRMIPTIANGQPAAAAYHRDGDGVHHAFGLGVLTVTETGIARILVFGGGAGLVPTFGLPPVHPGVTAPPGQYPWTRMSW